MADLHHRPRSAPKTAQTLDFIGYRGACPQFFHCKSPSLRAGAPRRLGRTWRVDACIVAKFGNAWQGDCATNLRLRFRPTPTLLGTDPAEPLILLAQIAICPESHPPLPRLRLPRRNPPPPAASRTPARPSAPFLPQSHLHELEASSTHFSGVLYMNILSNGVTMP